LNTHKLLISGIVQGVGFRPHVYKLALKYNIKGYVLNNSSGVEVVATGNEKSLKNFENELEKNPPEKSKIYSFKIISVYPDKKYSNFKIRKSIKNSYKTTPISPDLNVCDECLEELFNPVSRRFMYPFINCTNCGPRFTIIEDIPYDRPKTTMKKFKMCIKCIDEYENPLNRRFHAQPNGCHQCGPELKLTDNSEKMLFEGNEYSNVQNIFKQISHYLSIGKILCLKGIGGFHLVCDGLNDEAVATLRSRKIREDKPFAVMFPNVEQISEFCYLNNEETELLKNFRHPIVLLKKEKPCHIAYSVAPKNHFLGCMLPYTPIHHLLLHFYQKPLVMTSANISNEPIIYDNYEAYQRLGKIADYYLVHNRKINIRCDDSVTRVFNYKDYPIRRSRGYAPESIELDYEFRSQVLACGAEQKNTFALAKNKNIYLSQHIGDMENYETLKSFESGIKHFSNIFDVNPEVVGVDYHPDYLSTKFGNQYAEQNELKIINIQHHHAHAVSCMVENKINQPTIALVLDGTGYGLDNTIWGGECLIAEYDKFERIGHLQTIKMPGSTSVIQHPWKMGLSYLYEIFGEECLNLGLPFLENVSQKQMILEMLKKGLNSPVTSSCGRLFDGVAAICGIRNNVNYEGQAAIEFEQFIVQDENQTYPFQISNSDGIIILQWKNVIEYLVKDVLNGEKCSLIALKFHNGLAKGLLDLTIKSRERTNINIVTLSGGVFMNIFLLNKLENLLKNHDFTVFIHNKVPTNDGGISLGQAIIADSTVNK